jgi:hypothetical protein
MFYPNTAESIPYYWMPKYIDATDSSARTLDLYKNVSKPNHSQELEFEVSVK